MRPRRPFFLLLICALLVTPATADDITGKEKILSATVRATECYAEGGCLTGTPENWNLPRFMRVDLAEMRLSTTEASGESRTTSIQELKHEGDDFWPMASSGVVRSASCWTRGRARPA